MSFVKKIEGLYPEQLSALFDCFSHIFNSNEEKRMVFNSPAGTGKTFTIHKLFEALGNRGVAVSFTGRASIQLTKGMPEGIQAQTIHSLLYDPVLDEYGNLRFFTKKPIEELRASCGDFIIVDESSMVPRNIYEELVSIGLPIIFVGDNRQLPPVTPPNVPEFNVMTDLEDVPRTYLSVNRRTDQNSSGIVHMYTHLREKNSIPRIKKEGLRLIPKSHTNSADFFKENGFDMVICGMNKTRRKVNNLIRKSKGFQGEMPEPGERIVCLQNNYINSIFVGNGDLFEVEGIFPSTYEGMTCFAIRSLDRETGTLYTHVLDETWETEKFPEGFDFKKYKFRPGLFTFGHCLTAHKCQGSTLNNVLFIDENVSFFLDQQKFRYTAVTRAAKHLTVTI